eukprot:10904013-Alexandrium_andersonii.AAC.1
MQSHVEVEAVAGQPLHHSRARASAMLCQSSSAQLTGDSIPYTGAAASSSCPAAQGSGRGWATSGAGGVPSASSAQACHDGADAGSSGSTGALN